MARVEELSVEDIRKRYSESAEPVSAQILNRLRKDPRLGVRKLLTALEKRYEREQRERTRLDAMRHFELVLWKSGIKDIAGVDEAGVAPLAGPVVAAAVMFPPETYIAASGGIFRDLHIHDFDAIRFVTGREIVEVYADGAVRETPWFERHGDVDTAAVLLRLSGGPLAVVTGTRHDALGYDVRLEVFGTADSIVAGVDTHSPLRSVEPGSPRVEAAYRTFLDRFERAYRAELAAFVDSVLHGGESACSLHEARAALLAALAADRSRHEHLPVRIEEVTSAQALAG